MTLQYHQEQLQNSSFLSDSSSCEEEQWEEKGEYCSQGGEEERFHCVCARRRPPMLMEQDLFWDEEELPCLFSREERNRLFEILEKIPSLATSRSEAVDWVLKVAVHHSFSALTAVLAVNYLDRLLFCLHSHTEKPWIAQLAAVTCLSIAAKVEETQVPLLLDLQVDESKYVFEAKTIQRMEILVMSTLQWKMNPVTPISFLDYTTRKLGLKSHLCWEFLKKFESSILFLLSECRFVRFLPSTIALASMLHGLKNMEPFMGVEYQTKLLNIQGFDKAEVKDCCNLIEELAASAAAGHFHQTKKRNPESFSKSLKGAAAAEDASY